MRHSTRAAFPVLIAGLVLVFGLGGLAAQQAPEKAGAMAGCACCGNSGSAAMNHAAGGGCCGGAGASAADHSQHQAAPAEDHSKHAAAAEDHSQHQAPAAKAEAKPMAMEHGKDMACCGDMKMDHGAAKADGKPMQMAMKGGADMACCAGMKDMKDMKMDNCPMMSGQMTHDK